MMAYSVDAVNSIFTENERKSARERRVRKEIKTKVIYTYKEGILESTPRWRKTKNSER